MDKLAKTGTYFSHAMVSTPICAASRASLLSAYMSGPIASIFKPETCGRPIWIRRTPNSCGRRAI
jgi:hypothetical protein